MQPKAHIRELEFGHVPAVGMGQVLKYWQAAKPLEIERKKHSRCLD